MIIEHFRPGQAPAVYRRFRDRGRMMPEDVQYLASWIDFDFRRCFQVMEAESEARLREWTIHWEDLIDFEIVPVRTSAEAAAAIAAQPDLGTKVSSDERARSLRERFSELHGTGTFVMPNAWDVGSARLLESLGFKAVATTSSGHAASLGRMDQNVTLDELLAHVRALVEAVDVPVSVDAERCFADDPEGVARTVERLAREGAAGVSIEDYDPRSGIDPVSSSAERVRAAARAARAHGIVLTARAENHLYGVDDLDDTIARLRAYRDAGADVVYAPGLVDIDAIARVVEETGIPVNVLARPNGPSVPELAAAGVRRVSTGGSLAFAAYGALASACRELLSSGTSTYATLSAEGRRAAFG
jgi:2-methylisocitrate lyase-like PEP mutase family enzyme